MSPKSLATLKAIATKAINAPPDSGRDESLYTLKEVMGITTKSRAGIYADMAAGKFPASVPLGPHKVGWVRSEIHAWVRSQIEASRNGTLRKSPKFARTKDGTFTRRVQARRHTSEPVMSAES